MSLDLVDLAPDDLLLGATAALVAMQAALMGVDELVFHRRRGLGRFERWGHPADSLVFALALAVPALAPPTGAWLAVYSALAFLSLFVITKDEWVHARDCEPAEHWLHAMLFVVHGPILIGAGLLWTRGAGTMLLTTTPLAALGFMTYQLTYWVVLRHDDDGQQRLLRPARRPLVR